MKAALYVRVSTDEQRKFGLSLEAQEQALKDYCKEHNIEVFKVYRDEGVSASTIRKRKGLLNLLDNLNYFDLILFTKLDRLSRNIKDAIELNEEFKKNKVDMIAIQDQYIDTSTANGEFIFNLRYSLAQQERKQVSERIKSINEFKRNVSKTACTGKIPLGYKLDEQKHYIIDEKESLIVKDLFEHYSISQSLNETLRWFNNKYNESNHYVTLRRRLRNKIYIGQFEFQGSIIENYFPPIIDKGLFNKVNHLLDINVKKSSKGKGNCLAKNTLFNMLLYCNKCGSSFQYNANTSGNFYYLCRSRYHGCDSKSFLSEKKVENYLLTNLSNELEKAKFEAKKYTKISDKVANKRIDEIKVKMNKLSDLYIENMIDINLYKEKYNNLKNELNKLENQTNNETHLEELDKLLNSTALEIYKTFTTEEKRKFWRMIIKRIDVDGDNTLHINFI